MCRRGSWPGLVRTRRASSSSSSSMEILTHQPEPLTLPPHSWPTRRKKTVFLKHLYCYNIKRNLAETTVRENHRAVQKNTSHRSHKRGRGRAKRGSTAAWFLIHLKRTKGRERKLPHYYCWTPGRLLAHHKPLIGLSSEKFGSNLINLGASALLAAVLFLGAPPR